MLLAFLFLHVAGLVLVCINFGLIFYRSQSIPIKLLLFLHISAALLVAPLLYVVRLFAGMPYCGTWCSWQWISYGIVVLSSFFLLLLYKFQYRGKSKQKNPFSYRGFHSINDMDEEPFIENEEQVNDPL